MDDENTIATLGEYDFTMELETEHYSVQNEDETLSDDETLNEESSSISEESVSEGSLDQLSDSYSDSVVVSTVLAAPKVRSGNTISFDNNSNIYELLINNQTYRVLFPKAAALEVIDGQLVNVSGSNITGSILGSNDSIPNNSYIQQTYTLLPATNSNSNNNRYQYGAIGYITTYSVGSYGLTSSQQYGNNTVQKSPNFGVNIDVSSIIIAGLLLALCLIQIIGGIFRR